MLSSFIHSARLASTMDAQDIDALNESLQQASPREILATLLPVLGRTALSFSGAEDVVLVD